MQQLDDLGDMIHEQQDLRDRTFKQGQDQRRRNAARGRVVDEPALVDALARRQIRGAAPSALNRHPIMTVLSLLSRRLMTVGNVATGQTLCPLRLNGALLGAAPPLAIYAFLMDYYIAGLTAGATKG